jgi:hypothetical protein
MKYRLIIMFLFILLLTALSIYGAKYHPWTNVNQCLTNPEYYHGEVVTHYREPMIGDIYSDGFLLLQRHGPSVRVYADTTGKGLIKGKYIGLVARFHKEGYLEAIRIGVSLRRKTKIWVSILPVLLIGTLFLVCFRWNKLTLSFELRSHA